MFFLQEPAEFRILPRSKSCPIQKKSSVSFRVMRNSVSCRAMPFHLAARSVPCHVMLGWSWNVLCHAVPSVESVVPCHVMSLASQWFAFRTIPCNFHSAFHAMKTWSHAWYILSRIPCFWLGLASLQPSLILHKLVWM